MNCAQTVYLYCGQTVHLYCGQTVHLYCEQTVHFLKHIYIKILRDIKGGELELWTDSTLVL